MFTAKCCVSGTLEGSPRYRGGTCATCTGQAATAVIEVLIASVSIFQAAIKHKILLTPKLKCANPIAGHFGVFPKCAHFEEPLKCGHPYILDTLHISRFHCILLQNSNE